jgi:ELWxxDGT repeat protein
MKKNLPTELRFRSAVIAQPLAMAAAVLLFLLKAGSSFGQAQILKDINAQQDIYQNEFSSLMVGSGKIYFINKTNELWKTTGNEGGTVRVKPFVRIHSMEHAGDALFLSADDGSGSELWKSTGTFGATVKLTSFASNGGGIPELLTNVRGTLYFVVYTSGSGKELWKSDGTPGGTVIVTDLRRGKQGSDPSELTDVNGTLYFAANDGKLGHELWKSDGTAAGTVMVKDVREGAYRGSTPRHVTNVNGTVFFVALDDAGRELWKTGGTPESTIRLGDIRPGTLNPDIENMTAVGNRLFFTANDGVHGHELWKSDGTPGGTALVKDMTAGKEGSHGEEVFTHPMGNFTSAFGLLYYTAYESDTYYIWKSDGTEAGTVPLRVASHGIGMPAPRFVTKGSHIFYFDSSEDEQSDYEFHLYRMNPDGSNPVIVTTLVMEDFYSPYDPEMVVLFNTLFFWGRNDADGFKLLRSNGSPGSLVVIKDISQPTISSNPYFMKKTDSNRVFFAAEEELFSPSLWTTDGTTEGTVELMEFDYSNGLEATSTHAFITIDAYLNLWKSDGTKEGTVLVKSDPGISSAFDLINVNDMVFFHTWDGGLWRTDGTEAGTIPMTGVLDIISKHAVGNVLLFHVDKGNHHTELWRSNGLASGTYPIFSFAANARSYFKPVAVTGDIMFFVADDGVSGNEVWRTDGTTGGTFRVADLNSSDNHFEGPYEFDIRSMAVWNDDLYISALDDTGQWALYRSDGTPGNAEKITELPIVSEMVPTTDRLHLFPTSTPDWWSVSNHWVTDGTKAGTQLINETLYPINFEYVVYNDILYFGTYDSRDLWRSDGTVCGTFPIDMEVFIVQGLVSAGDILLFNGYTIDVGNEPFVYNLQSAPTNPCGAPVFDVAPAASMLMEDENTISPYPNPFTEGFVLQVAGKMTDLINIEVFDSSGFPVETLSGLDANTEYRLGQSWEAGDYILKINHSGIVTSEKVIKK